MAFGAVVSIGLIVSGNAAHAQVAGPTNAQIKQTQHLKIIKETDGLVQLATRGSLTSVATHLEVAVAPNKDILVVWTTEEDPSQVSVEATYLTYGMGTSGEDQWTCSPPRVIARYDATRSLARVTKADVMCVTNNSTKAIFAVVWGRAKWNGSSSGMLEAAIVTPPPVVGGFPVVEQEVLGVKGYVVDADVDESVGTITPDLVWRPSMGERNFGVVYSHLVQEDAVNEFALLDIRWTDISIPKAMPAVSNTYTMVADVPIYGGLYTGVTGGRVTPEVLAVETDLLLVSYEEAPPTMLDQARIHMKTFSWAGSGNAPIEVSDAVIEPTLSDTMFRRPIMSVSKYASNIASLTYYELDIPTKGQTAHLRSVNWNDLSGQELPWPGHLYGISKLPSPVALVDSTICFINTNHLFPFLANLRFDGISIPNETVLGYGKRPAVTVREDLELDRDLLVVGVHSSHESAVNGAHRPYVDITFAEL